MRFYSDCVRPGRAALALAIPGFMSFIFAVVAENKKPAGSGDSKDAAQLLYDAVGGESTCRYPSDPTLALGVLAVVFLLISAILSCVALYYPYKGKPVSVSNLWRTSTSLVVFTLLSLITFLVAEALLLWAVIVEYTHRQENVHSGRIMECPTAKTGLLGGGGFLALDATLFFLLSVMLTVNARSDYLDDGPADEDDKGAYGEVPATLEPRPGLELAPGLLSTGTV